MCNVYCVIPIHDNKKARRKGVCVFEENKLNESHYKDNANNNTIRYPKLF